MLGNTPRLWGGMMSRKFYIDFWKRIKSGESFDGEITNRRKNGEIYYSIAHIEPIFGENKEIIGYIGTEEDVSDIVKINRAKSEFVSLASHQLRTPMTGIKWVIERFLKTENLTEKGKEYLNDIHTSVARLSALVDLLLNSSRVESGKVSISPIKIDVIEFVSSYLKECEPLRVKKNLTLEFDNHPKKLIILSDTSALRNIIQSIISNAIEYTPDGGKISVSINKEGDSFMFTVRDSGIGIAKEEQSNMFVKFFRASNSKYFKTDGTGLGVFIASEATKLLGGKIWFESEINKGTVFYVKLPTESKAIIGDKIIA